MAKHTFGTPLEEDDILEIQGKEYRLQPFGMRAFKDSLKRSKEADGIKELEGVARTESTYDLSVELIVSAVVPEDRERLAQHISDSVPPPMVSSIAAAIMRGFATDVDPTQPTSSSDGSSATGDDGTAGALDVESTPST